VLTGISEAVLKHRDVDVALDEALAECFDAGGIAVGALYLTAADGSLRVRPIGAGHPLASIEELGRFFGHGEVLREVLDKGRTIYAPSKDLPAKAARDLLARSHGTALLLVPLAHMGKTLGCLLMVSRGRDLDRGDWTTFARGVATQICHVLTLARAFADRQVAEKRAVEHAALLDAMMESAPDWVMHIDLDGTIRFINKTVVGVPSEQWVGRNLLAIPTGEHQPALSAALQRMISTGEAQGFEASAVRPDGGVGWYSTRLGPVKENGRLSGAVVVSRDVSDKKQTELHLMVADRMASVGTLAAGVAHEINNPPRPRR
jgi:PAS domain S-box-containing protein